MTGPASTKILYVDDDPLARTLMVRSLDPNLFDVDVASGAIEALRKAAETQYEIVVTDVDMPFMDGIDLISELERHHPDLRFVVVTGQPCLGDAQVTAAVSSFVAKPWDREGLTNILLRTAALKDLHAARSTVVNGSLLVVEDDPVDSEILLLHLTQMGWNRSDISVARTLVEALHLLNDRSFSVIVSDLGLPDALGMDCVQRLREASPNTALVLLTGNGDEATALQAVQLGAHEYLHKSESGPQTIRRAIRYAQERARSEQRLIYAASHDTLTGLCNRASLYGRASRALARARRHDSPVGVLYIDLNKFKGVNDTLGHAAGDAVLIHVGQQLGLAVRDGDTVARLGGDEFAVLVEQVDSPGAMARVVERVRGALAVPVDVAGAAVSVEASIGVAMFPAQGETFQELLASADRAMYGDKYDARRPSQLRMSPPHRAAASLSHGS